jgi:uncharacterized protein with PIN domain
MCEHQFECNETSLPKDGSRCINCNLPFEEWLWEQLPENVKEMLVKNATSIN